MMAAPAHDPDALFGSQDLAGGEADLDDLFSSLPDAPAAPGAPPTGPSGSATQLFMEAVDPNEMGALFDAAPAPAAAAKPAEHRGEATSLFAAAAGGDALDLFEAPESPADKSAATGLFEAAAGPIDLLAALDEPGAGGGRGQTTDLFAAAASQDLSVEDLAPPAAATDLFAAAASQDLSVEDLAPPAAATGLFEAAASQDLSVEDLAPPRDAATGLFEAAAGQDLTAEDLFAAAAPAPAPAADPTGLFEAAASEESDLDDLFGGGAPDESDLFGSGTPSVATADLFTDSATGEDLFLSDLPAEPGRGTTGPAATEDLDDLFSAPGAPTGSIPAAAPPAASDPAGSDLDDLFGAPGGADPSLDSAEMDLEDLFGAGGAAMDPDALFTPTGTTGTQPMVSPDQFRAPQRTAAMEELSVEEGPSSARPPTGAGAAVGAGLLAAGAAAAGAGAAAAGDSLDDLFSSLPGAGGATAAPAPAPPAATAAMAAFRASPGGDESIELDADDLFAADPAPRAPAESPAAADGLFGQAPGDGFPEGDVSMMDFRPPRAADESARVDVEESRDVIMPPPRRAQDLEALFGAEAAPPEVADIDRADGLVLETDPAWEVLQQGEEPPEHLRDLLDSDRQENAPQVPGLEAGDLIREAHAVADAGGEATFDTAGGPEGHALGEAADGGARAHRPDRRKQRGRVQLYPPPPKVGWVGRIAAGAGLFAASTLLGAALRMHPMAKDIALVYVASTVFFSAATLSLAAYATGKIRLPFETLSRVMVAGAAAFVLTGTAAGTMPPEAPLWGMALGLAFAVATVLELDLLFLSLRISLAIVGVYSSLSLLSGLLRGTPYLDLVTRRILQAPGLAGSMSPDQLELMLRAFDPLFMATNFFLPVVAVIATLQALWDMKRRWWGLAGTRLVMAGLAGAAVYWNLGLYAQKKVPNLLSLAGLG